MSVFLKIKHLFKHSAIYSFATILQKLSAFLLIPFLTDTSLISTKGYSGYLYIVIVAGIISQILSLGMESTIVRFIKLSPDKKNSIVNSAITIVLLMICIGVLVIYPLRDFVAEYALNDLELSKYVIIVVSISAFDLLSNLPNYYFRANERPVTFTVYKIIRFLTEFGSIYIGLTVLKMGLEGAIYGLFATSVVSFLIMLPFYFKYFRIHFDQAVIKEMLSFGLPLLPNAVLYMLIEISDRYFIENIVGKDTQTIYTNMYKFGGVLTVINMAFRSAWQPIMLREVKENNNKQFFSKVMTYFVVLSSTIMVFISLLAIDSIQFNPYEPIRSIINDPKYYDSKYILGFILFGYVMLGIYYNLSLAFYVTKKSMNMMIYTGLGFLVNIIVNCTIFIYPENAMYIASFATFLSFFVMSFCAYIKSKELFPVNYDIKSLMLMFVYMFSTAVIVTFFGDMNFVYKCFIAFGYIGFLFTLKIVSTNDFVQIKRMFGR